MLGHFIYYGRQLYQYNEDDFRFKFSNSIDSQKHGNIEKQKLSLKQASL